MWLLGWGVRWNTSSEPFCEQGMNSYARQWRRSCSAPGTPEWEELSLHSQGITVIKAALTPHTCTEAFNLSGAFSDASLSHSVLTVKANCPEVQENHCSAQMLHQGEGWGTNPAQHSSPGSWGNALLIPPAPEQACLTNSGFAFCFYKTEMPSPPPTADQVPLTWEIKFFMDSSFSSGWLSSSGLDLIPVSLISLQLRTANASESSSLPSRSKGRTSSTKQAGIHRQEIIYFFRNRKIKYLDHQLLYRHQLFVCQIFQGRPLPRMLWLIPVVMLNLCWFVKCSSRKV